MLSYTTKSDARREASAMLERSEYRGNDLRRATDALTALLWTHRSGCVCDSGEESCLLAKDNENEFWRWLDMRAQGAGCAWLYGPDSEEEDDEDELGRTDV